MRIGSGPFGSNAHGIVSPSPACITLHRPLDRTRVKDARRLWAAGAGRVESVIARSGALVAQAITRCAEPRQLGSMRSADHNRDGRLVALVTTRAAAQVRLRALRATAAVLVGARTDC